VPPLTETAALPLHAPLQVALICVATIVIAGGCVMLTVRVAVQPLASVTITVYVPAQRPVAVAAVPPAGDQLNV
jgi:hypothetical protein